MSCVMSTATVTDPSQFVIKTFQERGSQLCNCSITLFYQKFPAFSVLVTNRGERQTSKNITDIATIRLNRPRGRFSVVQFSTVHCSAVRDVLTPYCALAGSEEGDDSQYCIVYSAVLYTLRSQYCTRSVLQCGLCTRVCLFMKKLKMGLCNPQL